ncbi:MAG: GNAT family N-acetyltransferase [Pseudomonadota bacterium]
MTANEFCIAVRLATAAEASTVLPLIQTAFADNAAVIDPPSSVERMTTESLAADLARYAGYVAVSAGAGPVGFVLTRAQPDALYWGRLAVARAWRGRGVASRLMTWVEARARQQGFERARIEVRLALRDQQRIYAARGYLVAGFGTHDGYASPTYQIMEKQLSAADSNSEKPPST